jgi:restriction system protein
MLRLAADGQRHELRIMREQLAREFGLSDDDLKELLPSGKQTRFANRVAWAKVHLSQAGLLKSLSRGLFEITDRGRSVLADPPERITVGYLNQFPEFQEFRSGSREKDEETAEKSSSLLNESPEELLQGAYREIRSALSAELLERVKTMSPLFFERLVVNLLINMGYGGSSLQAGEAIGGSGDEGIDGVINEDRLGLDVIYIQAKRWQGSVGRPEVQKFVGALHGKRARKGVFITTGTFASGAIEYVAHIEPKVVLIDGRALAEYMIDFNVGVTTRETYEIKRVDSDFFVEE